MSKVLLGDLSWFLRLLFPEPEPETEEKLLEMYREWHRSRGEDGPYRHRHKPLSDWVGS